MQYTFEWDDRKEQTNRKKHGVSFYEAQQAFLDHDRIIAEDVTHSTRSEKRYYCFGKIADHIMTVRFTYRDNKIRIIGGLC
ncbi:MAG: BrnT family toxin [Gammaproteobacteria bacterium]|nr:BrnT family toxin [Gammaproteobacteria bacterium]